MPAYTLLKRSHACTKHNYSTNSGARSPLPPHHPAPGDKQDTQSTREGHTARLTPNLPALLILKKWRVRLIAYLGTLLLAFQLPYSEGPQYLHVALS